MGYIYFFGVSLLVYRTILHLMGSLSWAITVGSIGEILIFVVIGVRIMSLSCSGD